MSITINVSKSIAEAIQASPDGMERARQLLEREFSETLTIEPCEGQDLEDLVTKVNAALEDRDLGMTTQDADAKLAEHLPWLKVHLAKKEAA